VTTTPRAALSIPRLRAELAGNVIAPDDPAYERARLVFYPQFDRRPAAIVRPVDADDVAYVVSLAREHELELAVRSGGHSVAGTASARAGSCSTSLR
jgi:FAD/FMN-containing dehydrogenase